MREGFKDLLEGQPTWRDLVVEALKTSDWDLSTYPDEDLEELADHILSCLGKAARPP
jgi:hypothetical protein